MYDAFMFVTGLVFIILTIVSACLLCIAWLVAKQAVRKVTLYDVAYREVMAMRKHYMDAIERSNEVVVEKFRHDLDCHSGDQSK